MIKNLPQQYIDFIKPIQESVLIEYDEFEYRLFSLSELLKPIDINNNVSSYWQQWSSWIKMYEELSEGEESTLLTDEDEEVPFHVLIQCIVIGEDNGDIIYIDPNRNNSIWKQYHDGADLELIENELELFLTNLKIIEE